MNMNMRVSRFFSFYLRRASRVRFISSPPPTLVGSTLAKVEQRLGYTIESVLDYKFTDRSLLEQTFSRFSASHPMMRSVGDSALRLSTYLQYLWFPPSPGPQFASIHKEKLARAAVYLRLDQYLCDIDPGLQREIEEFVEAMKKYSGHAHGKMYVPDPLADIVKTIAGVIYIDDRTARNLPVDHTVLTVYKGRGRGLNRDLLHEFPTTQPTMLEENSSFSPPLLSPIHGKAFLENWEQIRASQKQKHSGMNSDQTELPIPYEIELETN